MKLNIVASLLLTLLLLAGVNSKASAQEWRWHRWSHCQANCADKDKDATDAKYCNYHPRWYYRYKYCADHCGSEKCNHDKMADAKSGDKKGDCCKNACSYEEWRNWRYNHRYYNRGAGY